jgi:hypothetical protein
VRWTGLTPSTPRTFALSANVASLTNLADSDTDLTYTPGADGSLALRIVVTTSGASASNDVTVS